MTKNDKAKAVSEVIAAVKSKSNPTTAETAEGLLPKKMKQRPVVQNTTPRKRRSKPVKNTIPDGFPEGTILNDDDTLTLPDGRMVQKIAGVKDEQTQTA